MSGETILDYKTQEKTTIIKFINQLFRFTYNEQPITFSTAEGLEIASEYYVPERTFKDWLKSNFFKHISHGQYEKRYTGTMTIFVRLTTKLFCYE